MSAQQAPNISADAGNPAVLANPNSPESLSLRAKKLEVQSAADTQYDAKPPRKENFQNEVEVVWTSRAAEREEITLGLFLAMSGILFLYALAPGQ